jgi:DNA-binding CsgD family transcriptional regulator
MLADGLSVNEIARIEGVAPNAAWKSIEGAKRKFKKNF